MSMLNQAHVEAICTGTYLEDYLDCLDALPDDLQRILTQIREIDLKIYELEKDDTSFDDLFSTLKDGHLVDSRCITHVHRMLLKMQEFEDEKIQLSASLMDIIETRSKQLELDRENLDPVTNLINEPSAPSKTLNVPTKRNNSVDCKPSSLNTVTTTVNGTSVPEPAKESQKQSDQKNTGTTTKKRKQRASEPATPTAEKTVTTNGSKSNQNTQPSNGNAAIVNPGGSTPSREKDEISAKKQSVQVPPDEQLSKKETKNNIKRKRRSKVAAQTRNNKESKEPSIEPEEPTYCLCDQISYGEMIGCDNDNCPIEWFHFNCVGLTSKPKGKWFCPKCRGDKPTVMKKCDKK